jgi:hypothetical protein
VFPLPVEADGKPDWRYRFLQCYLQLAIDGYTPLTPKGELMSFIETCSSVIKLINVRQDFLRTFRTSIDQVHTRSFFLSPSYKKGMFASLDCGLC